ncbi:metallophosphoesterase [Candidatus Gracilibacteria bacterium]|nr:metallophosphoesterase [Candidatus Gracilibacteria bacterium]
MQKRTLFIGDVHGCYDELMSLVEKIGLKDEDNLYFVGDLINKGPKSLELVEWIRSRPNTWSVLGNHEYFPLVTPLEVDQLTSSSSSDLSDGTKNWIQVQYEESRDIRQVFESHGHREWLVSLPHIIEKEDFILVHGGLHPEYGINTPKEISTLIRVIDDKPWYEFYNGTKPVIYGHWAVEGLRMRKNTIGIDTGCCFGGHLTAYCLETREIWQVRANRVHKEPEHWKEEQE